MRKMNKQFIPYELALKLKEIGFLEDGLGLYRNGSLEILLGWYNNGFIRKYPDTENICVAPLWQQAFDWFTKQSIYSYIEPVYCEDAVSKIKFDYFIREMECGDEEYENLPYHTYQEAQEALLIQLIKNLKNKL